jgi:putative hemolysin
MLHERALVQPARKQPNLSVSFAKTAEEVHEAQRLRYKVFAEEMGARLPDAHTGLDRDLFDPFCEHLLVRDNDTLEVVGTYRLLTPQQARKVGCFYSQTEFDDCATPFL